MEWRPLPEESSGATRIRRPRSRSPSPRSRPTAQPITSPTTPTPTHICDQNYNYNFYHRVPISPTPVSLPLQSFYKLHSQRHNTCHLSNAKNKQHTPTLGSPERILNNNQDMEHNANKVSGRVKTKREQDAFELHVRRSRTSQQHGHKSNPRISSPKQQHRRSRQYSINTSTHGNIQLIQSDSNQEFGKFSMQLPGPPPGPPPPLSPSQSSLHTSPLSNSSAYRQMIARLDPGNKNNNNNNNNKNTRLYDSLACSGDGGDESEELGEEEYDEQYEDEQAVEAFNSSVFRRNKIDPGVLKPQHSHTNGDENDEQASDLRGSKIYDEIDESPSRLFECKRNLLLQSANSSRHLGLRRERSGLNNRNYSTVESQSHEQERYQYSDSNSFHKSTTQPTTFRVDQHHNTAAAGDPLQNSFADAVLRWQLIRGRHGDESNTRIHEPTSAPANQTGGVRGSGASTWAGVDELGRFVPALLSSLHPNPTLQTREEQVIYDQRRLLARCLVRWKRHAVTAQQASVAYQVVVKQRMRRLMRNWKNSYHARRFGRLSMLSECFATLYANQQLRVRKRRQWVVAEEHALRNAKTRVLKQLCDLTGVELPSRSSTLRTSYSGSKLSVSQASRQTEAQVIVMRKQQLLSRWMLATCASRVERRATRLAVSHYQRTMGRRCIRMFYRATRTSIDERLTSVLYGHQVQIDALLRWKVWMQRRAADERKLIGAQVYHEMSSQRRALFRLVDVVKSRKGLKIADQHYADICKRKSLIRLFVSAKHRNVERDQQALAGKLLRKHLMVRCFRRLVVIIDDRRGDNDADALAAFHRMRRALHAWKVFHAAKARQHAGQLHWAMSAATNALVQLRQHAAERKRLRRARQVIEQRTRLGMLVQVFGGWSHTATEAVAVRHANEVALRFRFARGAEKTLKAWRRVVEVQRTLVVDVIRAGVLRQAGECFRAWRKHCERWIPVNKMFERERLRSVLSVWNSVAVGQSLEKQAHRMAGLYRRKRLLGWTFEGWVDGAHVSASESEVAAMAEQMGDWRVLRKCMRRLQLYAWVRREYINSDGIGDGMWGQSSCDSDEEEDDEGGVDGDVDEKGAVCVDVDLVEDDSDSLAGVVRRFHIVTQSFEKWGSNSKTSSTSRRSSTDIQQRQSNKEEGGDVLSFAGDDMAGYDMREGKHRQFSYGVDIGVGEREEVRGDDTDVDASIGHSDEGGSSCAVGNNEIFDGGAAGNGFNGRIYEQERQRRASIHSSRTRKAKGAPLRRDWAAGAYAKVYSREGSPTSSVSTKFRQQQPRF